MIPHAASSATLGAEDSAAPEEAAQEHVEVNDAGTNDVTASEPDVGHVAAPPVPESATPPVTSTQVAFIVPGDEQQSPSSSPAGQKKAAPQKTLNRAETLTSEEIDLLVRQGEKHQSSDDIAVRPEKVDDETREQWQRSFKSNRRTSARPSAVMVQAMKTRARAVEAQVNQATVNQAVALAIGHMPQVPMEKSNKRRSRRMSFGMYEGEASSKLLELWGRQGTSDDLFRPENNEVTRQGPVLCCSA